MYRPKSNICVICSVKKATTTEHIPPKGFFKGTEGQFLTVPACTDCNNGNSKDDEALRNYISAQVGIKTPESEKLWNKGALKSFRRNKGINHHFFNSIREVEIDGVRKLAFDIPVDLYQRVFERVTRGLWFLHVERILASKTKVSVEKLQFAPNLSEREWSAFKKTIVVKNSFEYWNSILAEEPENSVWIYRIHNEEWLFVTTGELVEESS
tara:strand:+ start:3045 stop:3677 length:633 start_codon:yes stop_codon:yes gene_type:complete